MESKRPFIPLYPYPPFSPHHTRDVTSDHLWDFPPIRERATTPDKLTQLEHSSDESDFPPIREFKGTPNVPGASAPNHSRRRRSPAVQRPFEQRSSPGEEPQPSQSRHPRPSNEGLGSQNLLNTIDVPGSVHHSKNIPRASLKRGSNDLHADDRPLKRKCVSFLNDNSDREIDWVRGEISDIKVRIKEIAEHLQGDVDYRLDEILHYVRDLSRS